MAEDGQLVVEPRSVTFPEEAFHTVRRPRIARPEDFRVPAPPGTTQVRVRVIEMVTHLVTREGEAVLPVADGEVRASPEEDVVKVAALERCGQSGEAFVGFVRGFGLRRGAGATAMAWDSQCLVVVGADDQDMAAAVNWLLKTQGGAVVVAGGEVLAEFRAPIGGIMSPAPLLEVVAELERIEAALRSLGSRLEDPLLAADVMTTAAIPHLRVTERGYVRLRDGALLGVFVEPAG